MHINVGYDLSFYCPQPTSMMFMLTLYDRRAIDAETVDPMVTQPFVPISTFENEYGNRVIRLVAPTGTFRISTNVVVRDAGVPRPVQRDAVQYPVEKLPAEILVYLLGSRYCDTDRLSTLAWSLFGESPLGWARVQSICDFVHQHIQFGYEHARVTKTAFDVYQEKAGVCRDYAHLAIAFCRCMNIPARYCAGYLGDIGVTPSEAPMDFSAWFEAYLGGQWHIFDPRHNTARVGYIPVAKGRDATDTAISTAFGAAELVRFEVWTDEVIECAEILYAHGR